MCIRDRDGSGWSCWVEIAVLTARLGPCRATAEPSDCCHASNDNETSQSTTALSSSLHRVTSSTSVQYTVEYTHILRVLVDIYTQLAHSLTTCACQQLGLLKLFSDNNNIPNVLSTIIADNLPSHAITPVSILNMTVIMSDGIWCWMIELNQLSVYFCYNSDYVDLKCTQVDFSFTEIIRLRSQ